MLHCQTTRTSNRGENKPAERASKPGISANTMHLGYGRGGDGVVGAGCMEAGRSAHPRGDQRHRDRPAGLGVPTRGQGAAYVISQGSTDAVCGQLLARFWA